MIGRARRLAAKERPSNVRFEVGTGTNLNHEFDVVLNPHAPFKPEMVKSSWLTMGASSLSKWGIGTWQT